MADGAHNGQGIYDPFLDPYVFNDDVLYLLDMNGGMDPPPPLQAAPGQTATISAAGPSGDNSLLELPPPTLDFDGTAVHNSAPTHNALLDGDPTTSSGAQDVGAASTSATAPRPPPLTSSTVHGSLVHNSAPTHNALLAGDPTTSSGAQDVGAASTSATAPRPPPSMSSTVQQNASLDCTGCQVLREVVHSNGLEATKLSIHGVAAGVFNHATLEAYRIDSYGPAMTIATQLTHQSYVDFRGRDYVWVKHFLTDYAQQRAGGGYIVLEDSISAFQDALCTSMVCGGGRADNHHEAVAQEINGGRADDHREAVAQEINGGRADDHREAGAQEINGGHADDDHREAVSIEINGSHQRVVGGRAADDGRAVQPAMVAQGNVNLQRVVGGRAADDGRPVEPGMVAQGSVNVPAEAPAGPSEPVAREKRRRPEIRPPAAKTALSIQRDRASNLQLDDIARYFHLPMVEAAKELRICATVLKTTSRKFHVRRWPYRKVKSIDRQIAKLRRGNGDQAAMRAIERLTDYRRRIYAGLE